MMRTSTATRLRALLFAVIAAVGFSGITFSEDAPESKAAKSPAGEFAGKALVVAVTTDDLEDGRRFHDLQKLLTQAREDKAAAVVFDLNVRGGASLEAQQRLLEELSALKLKSFAFVNPSALGTGALVALGTDTIYMAPTGIIGGAGVVIDSEKNEEAQHRKLAQELSVLKARARSLAKSKGHDSRVAEAFIDSELEVKIGDQLLSKKGEVLTLTADEAARRIDGKPVLAEAVVGSAEALLKAEGITAEVVRVSPRDHARQQNLERISSSSGGTTPAAAKQPGGENRESESGKAGAFLGKRDQISYAGKIVRLTIGEEDLVTGKARFEFMDRTLKKARLDGATAVIFDMDTPGGFAWATEGLLLNSLQDAGVPTITFVNTRAESAGAIIAMGTDTIYMRPAATIGSALVVAGGGADLPEALNDKITQMSIATIRNMAELKGHNPDIAEAFVTQDKEGKIDGVVIHEAGHVLNLNTIDASREVGGRPVLANGVANSIEEVIAKEGLEGELIDAQAYGMESFAHLVQKYSFVLIILGLAGAYTELKMPGFGVPGVVSLLSFGLFFFGNHAAGNLAGYELAVLLVLGLILIGVEVFILPGTIIPGLVGATLVLVSLVMAMVDSVDFAYSWEGLPGAESWGGILGGAFVTVAAGLIGSVALLLVAMRYLPESKAGRWMVLKESIAGGPSIPVEAGAAVSGSGGGSRRSYIGLEGEALTDLHPAGKGRFGDLLLDIISDGEYLEEGTSLRVVTHEGSRIVVMAKQE